LPRFVTALFAIIDSRTGRLDLASAGHCWPLRHSAGAARAEPIVGTLCGSALGLEVDANYTTVQVQLQRRDRLMFYTDGWTEEMNASGQEYGVERLAAAFAAAGDADPDSLLPGIAAQLRRFSGRADCADDLCAVVACV
jgi:sigma-B regulation protein RsbU (phosphoserine phosphatase)